MNSILELTGSQCREVNTGVIWALFLFLVNTRAAAFWINWRGLREQPDNKELLYSSLEGTTALTNFSASLLDRMCLIFYNIT